MSYQRRYTGGLGGPPHPHHHHHGHHGHHGGHRGGYGMPAFFSPYPATTSEVFVVAPEEDELEKKIRRLKQLAELKKLEKQALKGLGAVGLGAARDHRGQASPRVPGQLRAPGGAFPAPGTEPAATAPSKLPLILGGLVAAGAVAFIVLKRKKGSAAP